MIWVMHVTGLTMTLHEIQKYWCTSSPPIVKGKCMKPLLSGASYLGALFDPTVFIMRPACHRPQLRKDTERQWIRPNKTLHSSSKATANTDHLKSVWRWKSVREIWKDYSTISCVAQCSGGAKPINTVRWLECRLMVNGQSDATS